MEKRNVLFKSDMIVKGKQYKAGYAYEMELEAFEFDRLTRQGCIYAGKDAKYYQETKEEKPVKKARKSRKVKKDVDHKDSEQAEVQADDTVQD